MEGSNSNKKSDLQDPWSAKAMEENQEKNSLEKEGTTDSKNAKDFSLEENSLKDLNSKNSSINDISPTPLNIKDSSSPMV